MSEPTIEKIDRKPGVCVPWEEKAKEMPPILAKPEMVKKTWEEVDGMAYAFIWHMLVSS